MAARSDAAPRSQCVTSRRLAGDTEGSKAYREALRASGVDWQTTIRSLGCAEGRVGRFLSTGRQQPGHSRAIAEETARRARNERPGRAGRSEVASRTERTDVAPATTAELAV